MRTLSLRRTGRRPPRLRGFTLMEALVSLTLMALIALAAIPPLAQQLSERVTRLAARQLADDLRQVRQLAVARGEAITTALRPQDRCYVVHTGPQGACRCVQTDLSPDAPTATLPLEGLGSALPMGWAACNAGARPLLARQWPLGWQVTATSLEQRFDPLHQTLTPTASWQITDPAGRVIKHILNLMGRLRSCSLPLPVGGLPPC